MTIRTSIDAAALSRDLSALEEGPASDTAGAIGDALDAAFQGARNALRGSGLTMPNDDSWRECEAVIFDAIRRANPQAFKEPEPPKPSHSLSYFVEAERYWQFAREGSETECQESAERLKASGLKTRIRPIV